MSPKSQRPDQKPDTRGARRLTEHEIIAILRDADDTRGAGGKEMLIKVLKGADDRQILHRGLNENPLYGYYEELSEEEIEKRVNWMIQHGFLLLAPGSRAPVLDLTEKGWEIEKKTYAQELRMEFDEILESGKQPYDLSYLESVDPEVLENLLELLRKSGNPKYIPLLEAWLPYPPKRLRTRISQVIAALEASSS